MKKVLFLMISVLALGLVFVGCSSIITTPDISEPIVKDQGNLSYTEVWNGRGTDSERCDLAGQEGRPDDDSGWIHWVFSTKGRSTNAELVLSGTGSGTYEPAEPLVANVWHFFTPYFELEGLEAEINLFGGNKGRGGGLVISDYCPGKECVCPVLVNGDFEFPVVDTTQGWEIYPSGTEGLGWTVEWMENYSEYAGMQRPEPAYLELHKGGIIGWDAFEGEQYTELDSDWDGPTGNVTGEPASVKIYQDIDTCGQLFILKYAWSPRPDHDDNKLEVYWKGALIATHEASGVGNAGTKWTLETHTNLTSNPNSTTRLEFRETGNPDSFGMFLDAVSIEVQ